MTVSFPNHALSGSDDLWEGVLPFTRLFGVYYFSRPGVLIVSDHSTHGKAPQGYGSSTFARNRFLLRTISDLLSRGKHLQVGLAL